MEIEEKDRIGVAIVFGMLIATMISLCLAIMAHPVWRLLSWGLLIHAGLEALAHVGFLRRWFTGLPIIRQVTPKWTEKWFTTTAFYPLLIRTICLALWPPLAILLSLKR